MEHTTWKRRKGQIIKDVNKKKKESRENEQLRDKKKRTTEDWKKLIDIY